MNEQAPKNDFQTLVQTLRTQWRTVATVVVLFTGVVLAIDLFLVTPMYRSDAEVFVRNPASELVAGQAQSDADRSMANERGLAESRSVTDAVEAIYGDDIDVSVEIADNRDALIISTVHATPELAQEITEFYTTTYLEVRARVILDDLLSAGNTIGDRLLELDARIAALGDVAPGSIEQRDLDLLLTQRVLLSERLDQLGLNSDLASSGTGRIISEANLPDEAVSPNPARDGVLALAVSLILGLGLGYLRALLSDADEERDSLNRALHPLPRFVELPLLDEEPGLSVVYRPTAPYSEAVRVLRTSVRFVVPKNRAIQIVSAMSDDGKTTTTANLAYAMSADGYSVLMIDADIRNRGLSRMMGFESEQHGLATLLESDRLPDTLSLWHDLESDVWLLPAGFSGSGAAELLGRALLGQLIAQVRPKFDVVLVDTPPLIPVTDGLLVAGVVDSVLLTVGRGSSPDEVKRARDSLETVGVRAEGSILNGRSGQESSYQYGYGADLGTRQPPLPDVSIIRSRFRAALVDPTKDEDKIALVSGPVAGDGASSNGLFSVDSSASTIPGKGRETPKSPSEARGARPDPPPKKSHDSERATPVTGQAKKGPPEKGSADKGSAKRGPVGKRPDGKEPAEKGPGKKGSPKNGSNSLQRTKKPGVNQRDPNRPTHRGKP